jgi:exonuclease SbcC
MQILSVSLKNFKIHRDRTFEFQTGVNAICGENGSGKTSILEAIAWVLFNSSGDYHKEELRHQGSSSAQAIVSFISALDGRTYAVQRQTSKSKADTYKIYDPQLQMNLEGIHRVEDALQWLRQHLGMPPQTDLPKLFANVIGIPQGTFTADFLKSAAERRKVFDPILQVEEYKQAYQATGNLEKYAIAQVQDITQNITYFDDRLTDWDDLKQQQATCAAAIAQGEAALAELETLLVEAQQEWELLKSQRLQVEQFIQQLAVMEAKIQELERHQAQQGRELDQARKAKALCEVHQQSYEAYQQLEAELRELNDRRDRRDYLYREQTVLLSHINAYKVQQAQLQAQMDQFELLHQELASLAPDIPRQEAIEDQRQAVAEHLQTFTVHKVEQKRFLQQQRKYQDQLEQLNQDIAYLERLAATVASIPTLEADLQRCQAQLTHCKTAQQFAQQLETIVQNNRAASQGYQQQVARSLQDLQSLQATAPIFGESCDRIQATLQAGVSLQETQVRSLQQLLDYLSAQADEATLTEQIQALGHRLEVAKQCQLEFARLETQQSQRDYLTMELHRIQIQLDRLAQALAGEENLLNQYQQLQLQLMQLGDPKGRSRVLQEQLQEEPAVQHQWQALQQTEITTKNELESITEQLNTYGGLDEQIKQQEQAKLTHEAGYLTYLQNERMASSLALREQHLQEMAEELKGMWEDQTQASEFCAIAQQELSADRIEEAEQQYQRAKTQKDQLEGALPEKRRELQRLETQLQQRMTWAEERDRLQATLQSKQQILQFIQDARRIYNQSGSRITEFYLGEIRHEGDRLFRELMNRQSVALTWTEDYEIRVQEGGTWRAFRTLSGGEQMAAALAVRLALLKVLAELDVAFFDEPTTNMDHDRRVQLSESLGNLKTFRQLFVISHDDTFENLTENVIRVERALL